MKDSLRDLTALDLARAIIGNRWMRATIIPTYTPPGWWECDVCEITDAGYMHEFEIKLTRGDFRADAKKTKHSRGVTTSKHDLLAAGDPRGPNRFSFLVPEGLIEPDELPPWAGLVTCRRVSDYHVAVKIVRAAPRLHPQKRSDGVVRDIWRTCYYRWCRLRDTSMVVGVTDEDMIEGAGI